MQYEEYNSRFSKLLLILQTQILQESGKMPIKPMLSIFKVWDEIRGLLTESTLTTNDYPTEIRDTLNEISLYQDLINQNCNLSTAAVAA